MNYEPLNRRLSILTATFLFIGVLLGVISLGTNYWTTYSAFSEITNPDNTTSLQYNGTVWNGLFYTCRMNFPCDGSFWIQTFIICLIGLLFVLSGGILSAIDMPRESDRRFITTLLILIGCILITAGLFDYSSLNLLNYHSSRLMIAALVFSFAALPISAFVSGRYSASERTILVNNDAHDTPEKFVAAESNGL